jgi:hypothetical protein
MSTALSIAAVTAVLKDLLNNGLIDHNVSAGVGEVTVSALPPDRIDTLEVDSKKSRLNLFLYNVTPNVGWRNVGFPSHNGSGERVNNPPLALDLHYLLTAYGAEEFHAEILLGYGMQLLHETPVLPREAIRISLAPPTAVLGGGDLPPAMQALFTSGLAEQVEQIKIIPEALNTEELSKLWPAFQAKYRPTAAYQVSVVLIESRRSTRAALPVLERYIHVVPFQHPVIEQVKSQTSAGGAIRENQPILAEFNLVLVGRQLRGEDTVIRVGGIEVKPADSDVTDKQIIVPIPGGLQAGVQGVQVIQRTLLGSPPTPHRGFESNAAAFVLCPRLVEPIGIANPQGTGIGPRSARMDLTVDPAVGDTQRVVLFLNELIPVGGPPGPDESQAQAYSFIAPSRIPLSPPIPPGPSQNISIPISGVKAGDYLVRIQVDGAESPLGTDVTGRYNSPMVTIP